MFIGITLLSGNFVLTYAREMSGDEHAKAHDILSKGNKDEKLKLLKDLYEKIHVEDKTNRTRFLISDYKLPDDIREQLADFLVDNKDLKISGIALRILDELPPRQEKKGIAVLDEKSEKEILAKLQDSSSRERTAKELGRKYFGNKMPEITNEKGVFRAGGKILDKLEENIGKQSGDYDFYCFDIFWQEGRERIKRNMKAFITSKSDSVRLFTLRMLEEDSSLKPDDYKDIILDYAGNDASDFVRKEATKIIGKMKTDDFLKIKGSSYEELDNIIVNIINGYQKHDSNILYSLMERDAGFYVVDKKIGIEEARKFFNGEYGTNESKFFSVNNIESIQADESMFGSWTYKRDSAGNIWVLLKKHGDNSLIHFKFIITGVKDQALVGKCVSASMTVTLMEKHNKWFLTGLDQF